jgi:acetolactate synthase-1/2/3 large subunit
MGSSRVADVLVAMLAEYGVDRAYCVAGESFLAALDALGDSPIDVVTCRHEASAALAALADGKLTGRPGVCLVNRGPGASNAAIAVHAARQEAAPLLLVVGQLPRGELGRAGFQEMDYQLAFADQAKHVWTLLEARHAAEMTARALRASTQGTPGPVVLVVPEDLFEETVPEPPATAAPASVPPAFPDPGTLAAVAGELARARRPLLLGGGLLAAAPGGRQALRQAAEQLMLPVAVSNKHQDLIDNRHPLFAGHLHIATQVWQRDLLASADLLLAVGSRLDAVTTQRHTLPAAPVPAQPLVHVYPDAQPLGHASRPAYALCCDPTAFLRLLAGQADRHPVGPVAERRAWIERLREAETQQSTWSPEPDPGDGLPFGAVVAALGPIAEPDAVITVDAGNFTSWVHRYHRFAEGGELLGLGCGAMGFGVPAGVAAALRYPGRQVIAFVGDGGFLMTGSEFATAVQRRLRLVVVVADNGSYGTIRQHQERAYPGRVVATELANPDFAALARAYGGHGMAIKNEGELDTVLKAALSCDGPVVVSVRTSLRRISAYQRIDVSRPPTPVLTVGEAS